WQGAVRRPALRRDGSLGAGGIRRSVHAAGDADREIGRRTGSYQDVQERGGRHAPDGSGHAGVVQRAGEGNPLAGYRHRAGTVLIPAQFQVRTTTIQATRRLPGQVTYMKDLLKLFRQQAPVEDFDVIRLGLAS